MLAKVHTLTIAGHQLHYRIYGRGSPLVLLHGYGVSGQMWQRSIPYLAQQKQVVVVDLPGHGKSTLPGPWRLREIAPLLATWLQQMHLSPVTLLGHSMGGAIAVHLTTSAPELVERLILVNAAVLPLQATVPVLSVRSLRSMTQWGGGSYPLALLRDVLKPRPRLLWQAAQEMAHSDFRAELTTLAATNIPTLLIWGERDLLLPLASGQELSHVLPCATFITMPRSGHRPPLSEPEKFSRLVLDFLKDREML
ncbi:MAG: alpha/beta hydrolase [Ktedonobacteraceae bacterium]